MASVPVAGFPENEFPCKVSLSTSVACQPKAPPGSLRFSWTCQLFLNVNIVCLRNGSRKRVHGAISRYGPRSSV